MASGSYDHPSYLTRQMLVMGLNTAGANGTSGGMTFPYNMRVRTMAALVKTAGTSATTGNQVILFAVGTVVTGFAGTALSTSTGTTTIGSLALNTSTAGVTATSTDMNTMIQAGTPIYLKNGTDATGVFNVNVETYIDPSATWTGS